MKGVCSVECRCKAASQSLWGICSVAPSVSGTGDIRNQALLHLKELRVLIGEVDLWMNKAIHFWCYDRAVSEVQVEHKGSEAAG